MLRHLNCISFEWNCENSVLFAVGEKYKTALIIKEIINFSVYETLFV